MHHLHCVRGVGEERRDPEQDVPESGMAGEAQIAEKVRERRAGEHQPPGMNLVPPHLVAADLDDEDVESERAPASCFSVNTSISPPGEDSSFHLIATTSGNGKVVRHQLVAAGDAHGQVQGVRTRVGGSQDDFESALTELQEMNEMGADTASVLARC